jgi:hypothetical protein
MANQYTPNCVKSIVFVVIFPWATGSLHLERQDDSERKAKRPVLCSAKIRPVLKELPFQTMIVKYRQDPFDLICRRLG